MVIIIEIDKRFTIGIDRFETIKGIRLGFVAIHFVFARLNKIEVENLYLEV